MLIIGTFEHSIELEEALTVLEQKGISRDYIMVVSMNIDPENPTQFISSAQERLYKAIEVGLACATASSVIGTSVGFILTLGPIFWGLTAAAIGFAIGSGVYLLVKRGGQRRLPKKLPEVTVIVQCSEEQSGFVMATMWRFRVLTVGRVPDPS